MAHLNVGIPGIYFRLDVSLSLLTLFLHQLPIIYYWCSQYDHCHSSGYYHDFKAYHCIDRFAIYESQMLERSPFQRMRKQQTENSSVFGLCSQYVRTYRISFRNTQMSVYRIIGFFEISYFRYIAILNNERNIDVSYRTRFAFGPPSSIPPRTICTRVYNAKHYLS